MRKNIYEIDSEAKVVANEVKLKASEIFELLKENELETLLDSFLGMGHEVKGQLVFPKENTVLDDIVLSISNDNPIQIMEKYKEIKGEEVKWIIILNQNKAEYYKKNVLLKSYKLKSADEDEERVLKILSSIFTLINRRSAYNANTFALQYGEHSIFYHYAMIELKTYFKNQKNKVEVLFDEWKRRFEEVYKKGDTTEDLFMKHTYLGLLIRLVLFVSYFPENEIEKKSIASMTKWLEERGVSLFTYDFFSWALDLLNLIELLFKGLKINTADDFNRIFEADDIFRTIYQQMVSPETRHALGEFYTPPELARLMIEDSYEFNDVVLDPACGSGTFLVEIMRKIMGKRKINDEEVTNKQKYNAIRKIYGFDINPIAIATSKANFLLILREFIKDSEDNEGEIKELETNIYLCNSLFPTQYIEQTRADIGQVYEFEMPSIKEKIDISLEFYKKKNRNKFKSLLSVLDVILLNSKNDDSIFLNLLEDELKKPKYDWLNYSPTNLYTLKRHIRQIGEKIFKLSQVDKNHIWTYLIFNSLGTRMVKGKADLVIGNPPWLVLRDIYSKDYQAKTKELAKKLSINPESHQITALEQSALFLYRSKHYLKNGGKIFFILSNAFLTGDNHAGTRQFLEFTNIEAWKFTGDVFNIHNVCLKMHYNSEYERNKNELENLQVMVKNYEPQITKTSHYEFKRISQEIFLPYYVVENNGKYLVKKLVPEGEHELLLPFGFNAYKDQCYQGATLVPRNLIFLKEIEYINSKSNIVRFQHHVSNLSKSTWGFDPTKEIKDQKIEDNYIYSVIKSTSVVPFINLYEDKVFLPIEIDKSNESYDFIQNKKSYAYTYFEKLDQLYRKKQKEGASVEYLFENLNYQNKLVEKRQRAPIKVVMMRSGTLAKACIVRGKNKIIDCTNYFIGLTDADEAYFLLAFLNAPSLTRSIQIIQSEGAGGGGRDIHKRPFEFKFPKYDVSNKLHQKIVFKAKTMEKKANKYIIKWIKKEKQKILNKYKKKHPDNTLSIDEIDNKEVIRPRTIQNRIYEYLGWDTRNHKISGDYEELDTLIKELLIKNL